MNNINHHAEPLNQNNNHPELYAARRPSVSSATQPSLIPQIHSRDNPSKVSKDSKPRDANGRKIKFTPTITRSTQQDQALPAPTTIPTGTVMEPVASFVRPDPDTIMISEPLESVRPKEPTLPKTLKTRTLRQALPLKYDIVSDVLNQKANIDVGDLISVSPQLKRQLISGCRICDV
ncbi:uncharacterized protein EV154DRAFT_566747 [Mucor mucedo]|uniref:uncharacterized protein n=1 Tax=Mucor mucedo TaxID=29922 RepID=UPI00221EEB81|nr:uncharacterized protein EV154DRAFT_566747 [Mucor mucedo]KAI7888060.1 hypothetical protein EV154DRAFT_566747 [Mucor mucedo]